MDTPVSTEWVKLCQYLETEPPHPLSSDYHKKTKDIIEIYSYFKELNPQNFMNGFFSVYSNLRSIPEMGQSKTDQVLKAVRLMKIAKVTNIQMNKLQGNEDNSLFKKVLSTAQDGAKKIVDMKKADEIIG